MYNGQKRGVLTTIAAVIFVALLFVACEERKEHKPTNPIGTWENVTPWDNNKITLTVRPDSTMLFKVEKSFCPGTKFFVSIGEWHMENDSILIMEPIVDGRHFEVRDLFPELLQTQKDSNNVIAMDISARLIVTDSSIYDISQNGQRVPEHRYHKISK